MTLAWTVPAAGGDPIDRYDYSRDGGYGSIAIWGSTATTHVVTTGLTNGTEYSFRVRAVNMGGASAWSNIAKATFHTTLPAPAAPTGLTATAGDGQATLAWTAPSGQGAGGAAGAAASSTTAGAIAGYDYSKDNGATWTAMSGSGSATTSWVVRALVNGTRYAFRVRANNSAGGGAASNQATVTPRAAEPGQAAEQP